MKVDITLPADYAQVVVDTNVLISAALLPQSIPAQLVDWLLQHSLLVFSPATFAELESRLWKPKFDRYLSLDVRKSLVKDFNASAFGVNVSSALGAQKYSRDSNDDIFIHTALAAGVSRLITGDDDLLSVSTVGSLRILKPRAALDEIQTNYPINTPN
jgi:uncharacterized protein